MAQIFVCPAPDPPDGFGSTRPRSAEHAWVSVLAGRTGGLATQRWGDYSQGSLRERVSAVSSAPKTPNWSAVTVACRPIAHGSRTKCPWARVSRGVNCGWLSCTFPVDLGSH